MVAVYNRRTDALVIWRYTQPIEIEWMGQGRWGVRGRREREQAVLNVTPVDDSLRRVEHCVCDIRFSVYTVFIFPFLFKSETLYGNYFNTV